MGRENKRKFKPSCDCCVVSELQKCRPFVLDAKLRLTSLLLDFGTLHWASPAAETHGLLKWESLGTRRQRNEPIIRGFCAFPVFQPRGKLSGWCGWYVRPGCAREGGGRAAGAWRGRDVPRPRRSGLPGRQTDRQTDRHPFPAPGSPSLLRPERNLKRRAAD